MTQEKDSKKDFSSLRTRAEEMIRSGSMDHEDVSQLSPEEIHRLIHELRVHQIELEMQNEELRQTQLKLEELKDKYLDLYDFAPVGYMTLNEKGLILESNLTATRLLGVEKTNLIERYFSKFVCEGFTDTFWLYLQRVFESRAKQTCEIKLNRKDGTVFHAQLDAIPIQDGSGQFARCRAVLLDITERKYAEEEREHLRARLLQSKKMETMGTLAGGISHDFNNMLQVILGYSDILLADKNERDSGYEELQKIVKTSQDAAGLVQKILIFGSKAEIHPVSLDMNHEIDEVTKLLSHTLPKTIEMDINLEKNSLIVKADPSHIVQALTNLAINASEAMPEGGRLTIKTQKVVIEDDYRRAHSGVKPGPYVVLTVSDTGRGIDQSLLERIFDPFYSTKDRDYHKGTGLGLSVVQGIVQQHGGHISVESDVGRGSVFRMYFPAVELEKAPEERHKQVFSPAGGTETILLVEDEELVRELGVKILEKFGYTVLSAADGEEALQVYQKERRNISLVILDIVMPRMDGKQCLMELLRITPGLKILIATGVTQYTMIQDIGGLGAKGCVMKPYGVKQILRMVRQVLDED